MQNQQSGVSAKEAICEANVFLPTAKCSVLNNAISTLDVFGNNHITCPFPFYILSEKHNLK